jgi:hypothetical protein
VPNFGEDFDITTSLSDMKEAEKKWKHKLSASFKTPKGHPVDYFVPNFGLDHEILTSQSDLAEAQKKWGHEMQASFKAPKPHPQNYFVPNFGLDEEIIASQDHTKAAEKKFDHQFAASFKVPKGHPKDYFIPNFGLDNEIITSQKNLKEAEGGKAISVAQDGEGNFVAKENVQLDAAVDAETEIESDPICSSAGCTQYKHAKKKPAYPMNYGVPNFGIDKPEVQATDDSLKQAEK